MTKKSTDSRVKTSVIHLFQTHHFQQYNRLTSVIHISMSINLTEMYISNWELLLEGTFLNNNFKLRFMGLNKMPVWSRHKSGLITQTLFKCSLYHKSYKI